VSAVSVKGSEWHRVRVGRFDRREDAEKLRETLRVAEKLERSIVTSR
jgi:cell division protein FtsN